MAQGPKQSRQSPTQESLRAFQTYIKKATSSRLSGRRAMPKVNEEKQAERLFQQMLRIVGCKKCKIGSANGTLYRAGADPKTGKMTYEHAQCKPPGAPVTVSVEGVILPSDQVTVAA